MNPQEALFAKLTAPGKTLAIGEAADQFGPLRVFTSKPKTLRDVLEHGTRHFGDQTLVVYEDERLSFREHYSRVASLSHWLLDQGVTKGDRVAIGMRNYPEWLVSFYACQAIGAIAVTLNAWWTGAELIYGLTETETKVAVLDGERFERLVPELGSLPNLKILLARDNDEHADVLQWEAVLAQYAGHEQLPDIDVDELDYSTILFTSGTTGFPKGALHTHRNHLTNIKNGLLSSVLSSIPPKPDAKRESVAAPAATPVQPTSLQTFPFFHIGGLTSVYTSMFSGLKLVLMYKWDVDKAIDLISREHVTHCSAVPTLVRQLLEHPRAEKGDLKSLGNIGSGGASVPEDLINKVGDMFESKVSPANSYGATETTSGIIGNNGAAYLARPNSVGMPNATTEVRIVDDEGGNVAQGEVGEIWVRGPNIFAGYWNNPEATEESFSHGWFKTGDLGYVDADGYYYIVDRKKDVIIRGGENVYCAQVETTLHHHTDIADVALIGLPHRELGEEVAAVIILRPDTTLSETDVKDYVAQRMAYFNVPTKVFFRDEEFPRNAAGKVLKRDLKEQYAG